MVHVVVDAKRYNEARARRFPDREPGQADDCTEWLRAQGVTTTHHYCLDFNLTANTVTIYRYAQWPYDGELKGVRFKGYRGPDGTWVMDRNWPTAALEWPERVPFTTPPPQWVLDAGVCIK